MEIIEKILLSCQAIKEYIVETKKFFCIIKMIDCLIQGGQTHAALDMRNENEEHKKKTTFNI